MTNVLLVDDEPLLLESLEIILTASKINVAGMAHDGNEALELLKSHQCEIALVDLNMKGMGGIELIRRIKQLYPDMKILVLTTFYDDKNITEAIAGGADGYLLKGSGKNAILGAIDRIIGGQSVIDQKVMVRMAYLMMYKENHYDMAEENGGMSQGIHNEGNNGNARNCHDREGAESYLELLSCMTKREKEICTLLARGLNNRQIADELYISEGTVKNYVSSIYEKTGIHDRAKLIVAMKESK